ncbi:MAG: MFS transporter [Chlamydiales bacterium]
MSKFIRYYGHRVGLAYLGGYLLNAPLFVMYSMLQFILCKDLRATALQITLLIASKPLVAVFSSYWSSSGKVPLKKHIMYASLIGALPSLLFPFFENNWYLVFGFALFFFADRAVIPSWMELLKTKVSSKHQSRLISTGSLSSYIAASFLPLLIGPWMDWKIGIWKGLFVAFSCLSLLRLILQFFMLPNESQSPSPPIEGKKIEFFIHPWKSTWDIMKKRSDFAYYQLVFFCGGLGLMIMQPALPQFIEKLLHLSYTELALAFATFKGLGFALTNPFWSSRIHKTNIFLFCGAVTFLAALSIGLMIFSRIFSPGIYLAFFFYGAMQAGSHLCWHLGGPLFSPEENSSPYTSVNIILVGVRGCVGPFIGGALCSYFGLTLPFLIGGGLCLIGSLLGLVGYQTIAIQSALVKK